MLSLPSNASINAFSSVLEILSAFEVPEIIEDLLLPMIFKLTFKSFFSSMEPPSTLTTISFPLSNVV